MKLFENGVGRPSNETLRKRRIFYAAIVFAVILVLGLGTYLLTNINSFSRLKGIGALSGEGLSATWFGDGVESSVEYDKESMKEPIYGGYGQQVLLTNKEGKYKLKFKIKNNNKYKIYYEISKLNGTETQYIEGEINSNSSKNIDVECNINNSRFTSCLVPINIYSDSKKIQSLDFHTRNIRVYYNKNMIMHYDYLYMGLGETNLAFGNKYTITGYLNNFSNKTIYVNWYKYKDFTDSKSTYYSSGSCFSVQQYTNNMPGLSNVEGIVGSTAMQNELQYKKEKFKVKAYSSSAMCKADKKGMNKTGVLYEVSYNFKSETPNYNSKTDYEVAYTQGSGPWIVNPSYSQIITYGTPTKLRKNEFNKEGYTFKGWIAKKWADPNSSEKKLYYGYDASNKVGWYEKPSKYYYYKDEQVVSKTVPAGEFVTMVAQWEKVSNSNITTNKTSFEKGQTVTLSNTPIYSLSTSKNKKATKSGTYYVWGTSIKNGRVRIAKKKSDAGKLFKAYGWVNVNDIK